MIVEISDKQYVDIPLNNIGSDTSATSKVSWAGLIGTTGATGNISSAKIYYRTGEIT